MQRASSGTSTDASADATIAHVSTNVSARASADTSADTSADASTDSSANTNASTNAGTHSIASTNAGGAHSITNTSVHASTDSVTNASTYVGVDASINAIANASAGTRPAQATLPESAYPEATARPAMQQRGGIIRQELDGARAHQRAAASARQQLDGARAHQQAAASARQQLDGARVHQQAAARSRQQAHGAQVQRLAASQRAAEVRTARAMTEVERKAKRAAAAREVRLTAKSAVTAGASGDNEPLPLPAAAGESEDVWDLPPLRAVAGDVDVREPDRPSDVVPMPAQPSDVPLPVPLPNLPLQLPPPGVRLDVCTQLPPPDVPPPEMPLPSPLLPQSLQPLLPTSLSPLPPLPHTAPLPDLPLPEPPQGEEPVAKPRRCNLYHSGKVTLIPLIRVEERYGGFWSPTSRYGLLRQASLQSGPIKLRFKVGDRVLAANCGEWKVGTVVELFFKQESFPNGRCAAYLIRLEESNNLIFAPTDDNNVVQVWQPQPGIDGLPPSAPAPPPGVLYHIAEVERHLIKLRFKVGDRVLVKYCEEWTVGTVAKLFCTRVNFPQGMCAAYEIQLNESNKLVIVCGDSDITVQATLGQSIANNRGITFAVPNTPRKLLLLSQQDRLQPSLPDYSLGTCVLDGGALRQPQLSQEQVCMALNAYREFNPTATLQQLKDSALGVQGWYDERIRNPPPQLQQSMETTSYGARHQGCHLLSKREMAEVSRRAHADKRVCYTVDRPADFPIGMPDVYDELWWASRGRYPQTEEELEDWGRC